MRPLTPAEAKKCGLPGRSPVFPWEEVQWYEPVSEVPAPTEIAACRYELARTLLFGSE